MAVSAALALRVQVAGPARGTTATPRLGVIDPRNAPLEALSAGAFAKEPTLVTVAFEELTPRRPLARVVAASLIATVDVVVVVVAAAAVDVVVGGAARCALVVEVVVEGLATAPGDVGRTGGELVDALRVKTKTKRSSGLDHITHCVLLSEWRSLTGVLEGWSPGQGEIVVHS